MSQTEQIMVLLVEDDKPFAHVVRHTLQAHSHGMSVHHATTLKDALECMASRCPDAIVLDLGLPDSQGLDTLEAVLSACPAASVVVLTGRDDEQLGLAASRAGAEDYVSKDDVMEHMLWRVLRQAVARKKMHLERAAYDAAMAAIRASVDHHKTVVDSIRALDLPGTSKR